MKDVAKILIILSALIFLTLLLKSTNLKASTVSYIPICTPVVDLGNQEEVEGKICLI